MNFVSIPFFVLVTALLFLMPLLKHREQNLLLLGASYVFYGWWNWAYLFVIIGISLIDYYAAIGIDRAQSRLMKKVALIAGLSANLLILGYFKYTDFLIDTANVVAGTNWPLLHVLLPIGVSFHTFQSMSYTIDVYREEIKPVRNPLDYQLFVTFFPQLVAGPIERASRLIPQITQPRAVTGEDFNIGIGLMLRGYFKKVVIADNLAPVADAVFSGSGPHSGAAVLIATYAFALQIYCDFSGYTDIARGVARLFGFRLMENFRQPYFAVSPSDFWRRWHISLSQWLRDYVYIPLGGNRHGPWRMYAALASTMLIGGIWHGASWTFVLWGAYHGVALVAFRLISNRMGKVDLGRGRFLAITAFFQFTCLGWMIFRAQTWGKLQELLGAIFSPTNWSEVYPTNPALVVVCALIIFMIDLWTENRWHVRLPVWGRVVGILSMGMAITAWAPQSVGSFIYFQF